MANEALVSTSPSPQLKRAHSYSKKMKSGMKSMNPLVGTYIFYRSTSYGLVMSEDIKILCCYQLRQPSHYSLFLELRLE